MKKSLDEFRMTLSFFLLRKVSNETEQKYKNRIKEQIAKQLRPYFDGLIRIYIKLGLLYSILYLSGTEVRDRALIFS